MTPSGPSSFWDLTTGAVHRRLRRWWYGGGQSLPLNDLPPEKPLAAARATAPVAPVDRVALTQRIWGTGHLLPGGSDMLMSLVKPVGVNSAMSLLDLSARLGGPSRHLAHVADVYITGMERSAELAKRGHGMSVDAGLGRKMPITHYDPETIELRLHAYDAVYWEFLTYSLEDKERLLREVMRSLKPRGQVAFYDYVLAEDADPEDARLKGLRTLDPYPIRPWRVSEYADCLRNIGFDLRISIDESDRLRHDVVDGFNTFVQSNDLRGMPRNELMAVLDEADLWVNRLRAAENDLLKMCRFYAVSTQGSPV